MKFLKVNLFVLVLASWNNDSVAEMIRRTDPASPGGFENITYDTETGLEWLDWRASANRTFEEAASMLGPGNLFESWRHATIEETLMFMENAGLSVENFPYSTRNSDSGASARRFFDLVGSTWTLIGSFTITGALTANISTDELYLGVSVADNLTASTNVSRRERPADSRDWQLGHALVRNPIPEASTLLLAAMGVICWCTHRVFA